MCPGNTAVGFINSFMITEREEWEKKNDPNSRKGEKFGNNLPLWQKQNADMIFLSHGSAVLFRNIFPFLYALNLKKFELPIT